MPLSFSRAKTSKFPPPSASKSGDAPPSVERRSSATMDRMSDIFHKTQPRDRRRDDAARSSSGGRASNGPHHHGPPPAALRVEVESPPLMLYGGAQQSSGALFSGQLILTVATASADFKVLALEMKLLAHVTTKKPVKESCADCRAKDAELFAWSFLTEPTRYGVGEHRFPFSHLLPGHLPITAEGRLGGQTYLLSAQATTTGSEPVTVRHPLAVARAMPAAPDRTAVRLFPPTALTSTVLLPPVIHPIGQFPVQLQLDGIAQRTDPAATVVQNWSVRRFTYSIEEEAVILSTPCARHTSKAPADGKGVRHEDVRSIGGAEMRSGWKTDLAAAGHGRVEMDFLVSIDPASHPICDVDYPTGLTVSHRLVLELVVAEEQAPASSPRLMAPTGIARVLRMQFALVLTERSGLGISWDEEQPPVYENVPASPPGYAIMTGEVVSGELEELMR